MKIEEYTIEKLNKLYQESESCDKDIFAEMRTNTLMVSGHHYRKVQQGLDRSLRNAAVDKTKRLRLVKNHTAKGISDIKDVLASMTPGVLPYPANEAEMSDQKAAELARSIWSYGKRSNNFDELIEEFRNSFVVTGEAASKVFYDPIGGGIKGYNQALNDLGEPLFVAPDGSETTQPGIMDEFGQMVQQFEMKSDEQSPVFKGKPTIEKIEPYNLLRPKNAKSIKSAKHLIIRKMVDHEDAEALIKSSENFSDEKREDLLKKIEGSSKTTYKIFDGTTGSFQDSEGQVMFREFFFRQSPEFPKGYFFITTEACILFQGELPFGEFGEDAFPIKWNGYDKYEGSARGFSPIKRIRPCQIEINRCASAISETQVTVGYDKIILQKGAKFSRGIDQPGMRVFYSTDGDPTIISGRSGDQFIKSLEFNIDELYKLLNIPENSGAIAQSFDARQELFKKQSQRARFTEPAQRLARFLRENCETYLFLAQKYMSDEELVEAVGKSEAVNIAEFKNISKLCYSVKLMEVSDDLESMMAKTLELDTILQYAGKNLDQETIKQIVGQYPAVNKTKALKHLTLELDNVTSDIMALERGEYREANPDDDHGLFIKHLTNRIKARDFQILSPQIQQLFQQKKQEHQKLAAQQAQELQMAQSGFIPSGGALVKTDFYVNPDPNNPDKANRAIFPTEALDWLRKKLENQGSAQKQLQMIAGDGQGNQNAMLEIAQMAMQQQGQAPQQMQGHPFMQ